MNLKTLFVLLFALVVAWVPTFAQGSLADALDEEEEFYNNFGINSYVKKTIEEIKVPYYDNFGNHITNGYYIYGLETKRYNLSNTEVSDSVSDAYNHMFQTSRVSEQFNNLIYTKDGLGEMKSVFLIGSQIQTRFSPLTMNMLNFQGIRWDIWTPAFKLSSILSRTRPYFMSMNGLSGSSYINYDAFNKYNLQGYVQDDRLPDEEYIDKSYAASSSNGGARGTAWTLGYDVVSDYTNKSLYGDYDILWGLHGTTNIANKIDVGFTYLNHHISDVKKGEDLFNGDVPDDFMPEEIHLEFYDLTPAVQTDAGVKLWDIKVIINGTVCPDRTQIYTVGEGWINLNPPTDASSLPLLQNGESPIITAFTPKLYLNDLGLNSVDQIYSFEIEYTVSGNYLVFSSSDKFVPPGYAALRDISTGNVPSGNVMTRTVGEYFSDQSSFSGKYTLQPGEAVINTIYEYNTAGSKAPVNNYSTSWFGKYIAKSPIIHNSAAKVNTTLRTYKYKYSLNVGSTTYGVDFKGKVLGVNINGEYAVNVKEYMYPGGGDEGRLDKYSRHSMYLNLNKNLLSEKLSLNAMLYNVDPQYDPSLENTQVSRFFSFSRLYTSDAFGVDYSIPDYLFYPQHLNNNYSMLDDNDDDDLFVDNTLPKYPSDIGSGAAAQKWYADGTFHPYKSSTTRGGGAGDPTNFRKLNYTMLSNGLYIPYGDDDGVYVDRYDRNKNGLVDYTEDFLLYDYEPPIFSLDNDVDNNGVWDVEDDDVFSDLPNGIKVVHVLTSNGWVDMGIRGLNFKASYTPIKELETTVSLLYEKAIDYDFNEYSDTIDEGSSFKFEDAAGNSTDIDNPFSNSNSFSAKMSGMWRKLSRKNGIEMFAGAEAQYVKDNIRNDAMRLQSIENPEYLYADYWYYTDELKYRNAVIGNAIAGVTYTGVPNLKMVSKFAAGVDKRMKFTDEALLNVRTVYSEPEQRKRMIFDEDAGEINPYSYESFYEVYENALIKRLYMVAKFDYTLKAKTSFSGSFAFLNGLLERVTIVPQYKFLFDYKKSSAIIDPRELTFDNDEDFYSEWGRFTSENKSQFYSIPILRANLKMAEKTSLQWGLQKMTKTDNLIKTDSYKRTVQSLQLYTRDNVSGYNVSLILGFKFIDVSYDALYLDPLTQTGSDYNYNDKQFFIRVYAGNN